MAFFDYWVGLTHKNPKLKSSSKITLTTESFKKELCKAFKAGRDSREETSFGDLDNMFRNFKK